MFYFYCLQSSTFTLNVTDSLQRKAKSKTKTEIEGAAGTLSFHLKLVTPVPRCKTLQNTQSPDTIVSVGYSEKLTLHPKDLDCHRPHIRWLHTTYPFCFPVTVNWVYDSVLSVSVSKSMIMSTNISFQWKDNRIWPLLKYGSKGYR